MNTIALVVIALSTFGMGAVQADDVTTRTTVSVGSSSFGSGGVNAD